ncbi:hypothetical protein NQZ68_026306, partial [Dissostichus eleginoides]
LPSPELSRRRLLARPCARPPEFPSRGLCPWARPPDFPSRCLRPQARPPDSSSRCLRPHARPPEFARCDFRPTMNSALPPGRPPENTFSNSALRPGRPPETPSLISALPPGRPPETPSGSSAVPLGCQPKPVLLTLSTHPFGPSFVSLLRSPSTHTAGRICFSEPTERIYFECTLENNFGGSSVLFVVSGKLRYIFRKL